MPGLAKGINEEPLIATNVQHILSLSSESYLRSVKRIAIFASGAGTNAREVIRYFELHPHAQVTLVVCNKPDAGVLQVAAEFGVETLIIDKSMFQDEQQFLAELRERGIELIVLAGFLWLIPYWLVREYPDGIINIHPSLLPKFGGKGMYGMHVHRSVIAAGERKSGITIHLVNEYFDEGQQLAQFETDIPEGTTAEELAQRIHELEHRHFAEVIDAYIGQ
jgi:phosphoribosylglycinamide formyltransferase-1